MKTDSAKVLRRTLGTLQPSAVDQAVLVGSAGKVAIDKEKLDTKRRRLNFDLENKPPNLVLGSKKDKECKSPKFSLCKDDSALESASQCRAPVISQEYQDTKRRRLNFDLENKPPNAVLGPKKEKECRAPKFSLCEDDLSSESAEQCRAPVVSQEAYNLMLRDDAPEGYWKQLAEERRLALEKALEENQRLHENVEILEAENKHLQKIADQCAELAEIVKTLTADDGDDDEEA